MNRHLRRTLTVAGIGLAATVFTPACAEDNQAVFINGLLAPPANRQQGACLYNSDRTQPYIPGGTLDIAVKNYYDANFLVGNTMIRRAQREDVRSEPNRAFIQGAIVRVTDSGGRELKSFTTLANVTIDPSDGTSPSYGALLGVRILDESALAVSAAKSLQSGQSTNLIAQVKIIGVTAGNIALESGEYQVPIRVCKKCLVTFGAADPSPVGSDGGTPANEACDEPLSTTGGGGSGAATVVPCNPGQDEATPCQFCRGDIDCKTPLGLERLK
jgi:hypothetical protein